MASYLRLYQSAVDPADLDEVKRLFVDDVVAVLDGVEGCLSVELAVCVEKNAGGLVEGAVVSRWASLEAMEEAVASRPVKEAIVRFRGLLRQEPVAKVFELPDLG